MGQLVTEVHSAFFDLRRRQKKKSGSFKCTTHTIPEIRLPLQGSWSTWKALKQNLKISFMTPICTKYKEMILTENVHRQQLISRYFFFSPGTTR
jgi:hypothetical protein